MESVFTLPWAVAPGLVILTGVPASWKGSGLVVSPTQGPLQGVQVPLLWAPLRGHTPAPLTLANHLISLQTTARTWKP